MLYVRLPQFSAFCPAFDPHRVPSKNKRAGRTSPALRYPHLRGPDLSNCGQDPMGSQVSNFRLSSKNLCNRVAQSDPWLAFIRPFFTYTTWAVEEVKIDSSNI